MAVYHLTARIVTRSKGHSAVHKAAYNARTQLHDERLGLTTRDYSDEEAILFSGIFAPQDAPQVVAVPSHHQRSYDFRDKPIGCRQTHRCP